ncbi:MAG: hypothetical protein U0401_25485 [Anaerolineae bacterium]
MHTTLIITFILLLTGCELGHEAEGEHLKPIDPAAWPTAKAAAAAASPTPFPKGILPTATPTAPVPDESAAASAPTTEPTAEAAPQSPITNTPITNLALNPSAIMSQFPVIATGIVIAPEAAIRQGPGNQYGTVSRLESGDVFGILGKNNGGDWVYIIDAALSPGWLPMAQLRVLGPLAQAPVLPPDPIGYFLQQAAASQAASAPTSEAAGSSPTVGNPTEAPPVANQPVVVNVNLKPVTSAKVNSAALNLRQGPGNDFGKLATLARDEQVNILALNKFKDWALVERSDKQQGWAYLAYLTPADSPANAPVVAPDALSAGSSASQASPVTNQSASNPAVESTSSALDSASADLGPLMTAQIAHNPVSVRPAPSTADAPLGELKLTDEKIEVLAADPSGQWVLVRPASTPMGWVAVGDLTVDGAPLSTQQLDSAPRVYTAWVESNAIETRSGPGIYHEATGTLAIKTLVRVLGLDNTKSWALVKAIPGSSAAWAPINYLKIGGRWADVPIAKYEGGRMKDEQLSITNNQLPIPSPKNIIVLQRSSGGDIMVIKPDGTGLRSLTSGIDPVLSPDGQTVAFTRWEGETGSLWLMNVDGGNQRKVLDNVKQAKGPDWSPDGRQIVMNFQQGGRLDFEQECVKLKEGSRPRPPRNAREFEFKLNDDFEPELCFTLPPDEHWSLKVVNLADGTAKDVDGGTYAFRPAWDPGQPWRIVSDGGRGLLELDVNRDYRRTITAEVGDGSPVFSPDGRFMAVSLGREGGGQGYDIFRLNADGTGRVRLTETPLWETATPGDNKLWNNVAPAWSPDGTQIAFLTDRTGRWEIWVMNADGSNPHPLFSDEINNQLQLTYNFVDERMLSWR